MSTENAALESGTPNPNIKSLLEASFNTIGMEIIPIADSLRAIGLVMSEGLADKRTLNQLGQTVLLFGNHLGNHAETISDTIVLAINTPEADDRATRDDSTNQTSQPASGREQLLERCEKAIEFWITEFISACHGIKANSILIADADLSKSQLTSMGYGMDVMATSILKNAGELEQLFHDVIAEVGHE